MFYPELSNLVKKVAPAFTNKKEVHSSEGANLDLFLVEKMVVDGPVVEVLLAMNKKVVARPWSELFNMWD